MGYWVDSYRRRSFVGNMIVGGVIVQVHCLNLIELALRTKYSTFLLQQHIDLTTYFVFFIGSCYKLFLLL